MADAPRRNHARVRELTTQLDQHGASELTYITRAYQERWPANGHPVNMTGYSNWAGAYSTPRGNVLVVLSLDPGTTGSLGLEMIFHEAMQQWDQAMMSRLERLSKTHATAPPRNGLTHALIWYTVAEALEGVVPGHVGYAEGGGMWKQTGLGSFKARLGGTGNRELLVALQ